MDASLTTKGLQCYIVDNYVIRKHCSMKKSPLSVSEIYASYKKVMYFEANKYLKDSLLIEESLQEMLIKIMKNIESIGSMNDDERYRYVKKVAKFTSIDVFNREVKEHENTVNIDELENMDIDTKFEMTESLSGFKVGPYVDEYIEKLSGMDREIITLVYGYNLSYKEISRLLKVDEAAARKRLSRAKARLKKELEKNQRSRG